MADCENPQAYFIYKLVRIFTPSSGERYETAKKTLTIFSILSFLMLLATVRLPAPLSSAFLTPSAQFIVTGLCYANFDRGLKEASTFLLAPLYLVLTPRSPAIFVGSPNEAQGRCAREGGNGERRWPYDFGLRNWVSYWIRQERTFLFIEVAFGYSTGRALCKRSGWALLLSQARLRDLPLHTARDRFVFRSSLLLLCGFVVHHQELQRVGIAGTWRERREGDARGTRSLELLEGTPRRLLLVQTVQRVH